MKYDPTRRALYSPGEDAPVEDFAASWTIDQICAELSRLSYVRFEDGEFPKLQDALRKAGFGEPEPFNDKEKHAQGFGTVAPDGTAFVAFRGTEIDSLIDILTDVRARLVPWNGGTRVHCGFREAYQSLGEQVGMWLGRTRHHRLVVTGHSLGAAMATLMATEHPAAELVTFGSPRVGDVAFADLFAARSVRRYVDCADGVPDLPPPAGYRHVSDLIYIDRHGAVCAKAPPWYARLREQAAASLAYVSRYAWRKGNVLLRSFTDHAPVNYVSAALGRREPD
jgi:pimeloyl-ACP methyl ester carboxylesterase